MKKFIYVLIAMFALAISANAHVKQQNYCGSSKFTDNVSLTVQGDINSAFTDMKDVTPIIVVGADKYVTPWLGFGVDFRTAIGTGDWHNSYTTFDVINLSGVAKVNVLNAIKYNGTRRFFEPIVYTGLGWGHETACYGTSHSNYMTWRSGTELVFNLGKERAWGVVVNPAVVWGNPATSEWATKLNKNNGQFELTVGAVYHFKNSNGTRTFAKAKLYNAKEVARLNARIAELEARKPKEIVKTVTNEVVKTVVNPDNTYAVYFAQNSAELTDAAKDILDNVPTNSIVNVTGSTSPEGTLRRNTELAQERAEAVKAYLEKRGVRVESATSGESSRVAVVTLK